MVKKWQNKIPKSSKNEKEGFVVLVKGEDENSNKQWAIALIHPSKYLDFKIAENGGSGYVLEDFGEVLASGKGENSPSEVIKEMKEKYGIEENFEEDFIKTIKDSFGG